MNQSRRDCLRGRLLYWSKTVTVRTRPSRSRRQWSSVGGRTTNVSELPGPSFDRSVLGRSVNGEGRNTETQRVVKDSFTKWLKVPAHRVIEERTSHSIPFHPNGQSEGSFRRDDGCLGLRWLSRYKQLTYYSTYFTMSKFGCENKTGYYVRSSSSALGYLQVLIGSLE